MIFSMVVGSQRWQEVSTRCLTSNYFIRSHTNIFFQLMMWSLWILGRRILPQLGSWHKECCGSRPPPCPSGHGQSSKSWLSLFLMSRQETGGRSCARFCINQPPRLPTPGIRWKKLVTPKIQVEQRGSVPARLSQISSDFVDPSCILPLFGSPTANSPLLMSNISFTPCWLNNACSHCLL